MRVPYARAGIPHSLTGKPLESQIATQIVTNKKTSKKSTIYYMLLWSEVKGRIERYFVTKKRFRKKKNR